MEEELDLKIDKQEFKLKPKEFSTGKKGYGFYGRIVIKDRVYQVSMNMIDLAT